VAAGDVNGDGRADIVIGKGADAEPRVKVIDATKLNLRGADGHILGAALLGSFLAYPGDFNGGVTVAAGDFNKDGKADVIVAPATGAAQVKVLDATKLRQLDAAGVISNGATLAHFVAYQPSFNGGVFVAAGDVNGDGRADIITGSGPGMAGVVNVIDAARANLRQKNGVISPTAIAQVFKSSVPGGIGVGAVDLDNDGFFEALVPAGPAKRRLLGRDLHHSRIALDLALAFDADSFAGG
jgi:trimeric autotransporter adhesin